MVATFILMELLAMPTQQESTKRLDQVKKSRRMRAESQELQARFYFRAQDTHHSLVDVAGRTPIRGGGLVVN